MLVVHAPALVDYLIFVESYPEKGGHSIVTSTLKSAGGAGANVAHNLEKLEIQAKLYTSLGKDEDAEFFIKNTLAEVFYEVTHELTGKVFVIVDKTGERTFLVQPNAAEIPIRKVEKADYLYLDPFPSKLSLDIQKEIAKKFEGLRILNLSIYAKMGFENVKDLLSSVDMMIMSSKEFEMLNVDVREVLRYVEYVIVTMGESGSACYTRRGKFYEKAIKAKVLDTTGAGDAFAAGFLFAFISGYPIDVCLKLGNFCGAYNVERLGARAFPGKHLVSSYLANILK